MVRHPKDALGVILVWHGGILEKVFLTCLVYAIYATILFNITAPMEFTVAKSGDHFLGGTATFLLVFKLNQCYSRMAQGVTLCGNIVSSLRSLVSINCLYLGGHDAAVITKVNVVRLAIAFLISLQYHARISDTLSSTGFLDESDVLHALEDLHRLKRLLTEAEVMCVERGAGLAVESLRGCCRRKKYRYTVDIARHRAYEDSMFRKALCHTDTEQRCGGLAIPPFLIHLLRITLMKPVAEKTWGYPERVLNLNETLLQRIELDFEGIENLIEQRVPLPYLQLASMVQWFFLLCHPLCIDLDGGVWANIVVPTILAMVLHGVHCLAVALENPFGHDRCNLNLHEEVHKFENHTQHIFDLSESVQAEIKASWKDMSKSFGLDLGGDGEEFFAQAWHGKVGNNHRPRYFREFFRWLGLPARTIKRIHRKGGRAFSAQEVCPKPTGHTRTQRTNSKLYSSLEIQESSVELKRDRSDVVPTREDRHDVFHIGYYCALKKTSDALEKRLCAEARMLEEADELLRLGKSLRKELLNVSSDSDSD